MVDKNNDVSVIIKTYAEDADKSLSTLITNLNTLNTNINKINTSLNKTQSSSRKAKTEIKSVGDTLSQLSTVSNKMKTSFNKMFDAGKLYLYWNVTKRIRDALVSLINSSIDYIETQNLFDVSMGNQSEKAYKFMNTMANTFGMARTELMNYQASFNNVLKSLPGLADETSYALSETLMKMAGDYASLFNFTLPQAMEKFQAALTGSVKPIRDKTGLDITEKTIQGVATNLGVEKTIGQLNQVEKRLLRIISLQSQLGEIGAMGDFAKTLESPSNQLKVLQQQLQELSVWLGNVFIGTIGKILPYINGFVMALVSIAKALAIFVGYKETKYDDPLQIESTTNSVDGLSSSLGGATSKAKELKKILMGFDVLNVITTPSEDSSGGGGGGGASTSIDPAILGALKEYDNLMNGVRMKAEGIRDKIMEWLGFEKIINEETGEITWKLKDGYTNLQKILDIAKIVGGVLVGLFIVKKAANFIIFLGNVITAMGKIKDTLNKLIPKIKVSTREGAASVTNWKKLLSVLGKVATVIAGIVIAFDGFNKSNKATQKAVESVNNEFSNYNTYSKDMVLATAELAAGGALIGSAFGPAGTVIGMVSGSVIGLIKSITGYNDILNAVVEKNYFGTITLSAEDLATINEKITSSVFDLSSAYEEFSDNNSNMISEFEKLSQETENVLWKYEKLGKEFATSEELYNSIKNTCEKSIEIIDDSTNGIIDLLSKGFSKSTTLSVETQKDILTSLKTGGETRKQKVKDIEDRITELYENAMAENRQLRKDEIDEIKQHYEELALLTESATEKNQLELNRIVEKGNDTNLSLSKESLYNYVEEVSKSYETATQDIEENYKAQVSAAKSAAYEEYKNVLASTGDKQKAIEKYNETINKLEFDAGVTRKLQIENLNNTISKLNETMLSELAKQYIELTKKTDSELTSIEKSAKKQMEDIFKAANLSSAEIKKLAGITAKESYTEMRKNWGTFDISNKISYNPEILKNIGHNAGNNIGTGITNGIKNTLSYSSFPRITATLRDSTTGIQQAQSVLNIRPYATGGLPDIGEMFVAREAGPELIGKIGNSSAVVNNQQIVESVSRGVAQAVSQVMNRQQGGNYNFYLDSQQITAVVTKRQNRNLSVMGV